MNAFTPSQAATHAASSRRSAPPLALTLLLCSPAAVAPQAPPKALRAAAVEDRAHHLHRARRHRPHVAGDDLNVESLTKPGARFTSTSPPSDLKKAHAADLVLDNGLNLESWFAKFVEESHANV